MGTDRLDRWTKVLMVLTILAVAVFAFVQSYTHLYILGQSHHQYGTANRMFPLSVDWVMFAAGLAMLHLGRKGIRHPLPRAALLGGVTATLAANIASGIVWGWEAALIAAWAPVALFTVVELGMLLVRTAHGKPPVFKALSELRADEGLAPSAVPEGAYFRDSTGRPIGGPLPEPEAVTASPEEALSGWGQLGRQEPARTGLEGIGLANGRK